MKKSTFKYGGQALLEGVMMQGATGLAVAVRDGDGVIRTKTERAKKSKNIFYKIPIVRGVFYFVRSLTTGIRVLTDSARVLTSDENGGEEKIGFALFIAVALALALTIGLFILLPNILANFLINIFHIKATDIAKNLLEGMIKIFIFIMYLVVVALMKDIKRTFMYHGAEHRVINAYERGLDLTVENVQKMPTFHPRCGTSFMFFVLALSIIVFSFFGWQSNPLARLGLRLAMLPLVAGLSYEVLKLLALSDSKLLLPFKAPGFLLQKLSTRKPDDSMVEVALAAFNKARAIDTDPDMPEEDFVIARKLSEVRGNIEKEYVRLGIEQGSDADWILADLGGCKIGELNGDTIISAPKQDKIAEIIRRRAAGEPLQYILGYTEFYGIKIKVTPDVLIPRPETELLAEEAIKHIKDRTAGQATVLDLCTGSGCIAAAVLKQTGARVFASDVSEAALAVARENAESSGAQIEFIQSDMFGSINQKFDIIISNPPYIEGAEIAALQKELHYEPQSALDGGADGLDFYRIIAANAKAHLNEGGALFLEIGYNQAEAVTELLRAANFREIVVKKDYSNNDRIVTAKC